MTFPRSPIADTSPTSPTEEGLEFIMQRIAALPTRRELIHFGVWVALALCVLAMIGVHMWLRWVWECSPL
jgi:hypothetical protein